MSDFNAIVEAIEELQTGHMVVLVDERNHDFDGAELVGEGALLTLAEQATSETIHFMTRHAGGPVHVAADPERLDTLDLQRLPGRAPRDAAVMVSVNASGLSGTGISAHERAITVRQLANPSTGPDDFVQPGHVTPLRARPGGTLRRAGHTEAAVDLARLAGFQPVALMADILDDNGEVANTPYLLNFAQSHKLKIVAIRDLIAQRRRTEKLIVCEAQSVMPTRYGEFNVYAYRSLVDDNPYIALVLGDLSSGEDSLVRMHSGCLTGDVLGSNLCDCGEQLHRSFEIIAAAGRGAIVYIQHHEGRGIGLIHKLKAYALQRDGMDTIEANHALGFPMDLREYGIGAQVLYDLGLRRIRVLTNNPKKYVGLEGYGLTLVEQVSLAASPNPHNIRYLQTKRNKMGHATLLAAEDASTRQQTGD